MSRTRRAERKPRDNYRVPKIVQDLIPIKRMWKDGIFLVGVNAYSKIPMQINRMKDFRTLLSAQSLTACITASIFMIFKRMSL